MIIPLRQTIAADAIALQATFTDDMFRTGAGRLG
jgi:hypothetical protein